jgi:hypothetical protein
MFLAKCRQDAGRHDCGPDHEEVRRPEPVGGPAANGP